MAHHSSEVFSGGRNDSVRQAMEANDAFLREIFAKQQRLGATGEFPQGHLTPEDEGEIRMGVTVFDGKVVVDFGTPTTWVGMDAEQARGLGELLIRRAGEIP